MIVKEVMSKKVTTVKKDQTLAKAHDLMVKHSIRHLPVVDNKRLLGIITESDLRSAILQQNSSSNEDYVPHSKMKISDYMTEDPLTVSPETNIEDAALLIYREKIGAVPVTSNDKLVGIISILDILGLFIDMMGIIHSSSRIDVIMGKDPKNFEAVSKIIHDVGVNIISVGMSPYRKSKAKQIYFFRLDLCETQPVVEKIEESGFKVLSAID